MFFQSTVAAVFFSMVFILPTCIADSDYTLQMYEYKDFGGEPVIWNGRIGQCGTQNTGLYVGSVVLPIGGVDCLIYTNRDSLCMGKATYELKYTESDINPSTTGGASNPNTWYSWKCWRCEYCGNSDVHGGSEAEPSKNNSLAYASALKTENDEGKLLAGVEYLETAVDEEHEKARVEIAKREDTDAPIEADDPTNLNDAIIRKLFGDEAISKAHNQSIEASDDATAHFERAADPRIGSHGVFFSKSHRVSDAAPLVPMRKLLAVALGAGVVAATGL